MRPGCDPDDRVSPPRHSTRAYRGSLRPLAERELVEDRAEGAVALRPDVGGQGGLDVEEVLVLHLHQPFAGWGAVDQSEAPVVGVDARRQVPGGDEAVDELPARLLGHAEALGEFGHADPPLGTPWITRS